MTYYHRGADAQAVWVFKDDQPLDQVGGEFWILMYGKIHIQSTVSSPQSLTRMSRKIRRQPGLPPAFMMMVLAGL